MTLTNTIFVVALLAYVGIAVGCLLRGPTYGRGFAMFIVLYPLFLIAYFLVSASVVMLVWLSLAVVNMVVQVFFLKRAGVQKGLAAVLVGSLFLWPIQFAGALDNSKVETETLENKVANREKIGPLPATIQGTVSFTHHHGTDEGHDSVWLEEYGELDFMTEAKTLDRIGIAEGKEVSLTIDERDMFGDPEQGKVLWIIDGQSKDLNR